MQDNKLDENNNRSERSLFFKATKVLLGTQVQQLKSQLTVDGQLKIQVPFIEQKETVKSIRNLRYFTVF